ncbi:hypothetical protein HOT75_gp118 [Gordonia phage Daredevil]|uniref:Uncharacterized protein n=1 Tax=Gordonia phage Daredevil TaxID=2283286 RepID=A0A345MIX4_9CAUD|nr:hypothetical protein HOT75_gp118 [Gordonia phage Daredevil]AXH70505.1 hypothetical protein SEA_DAREDEVIL_118 [Gordonia phage Daredevil]
MPELPPDLPRDQARCIKCFAPINRWHGICANCTHGRPEDLPCLTTR